MELQVQTGCVLCLHLSRSVKTNTSSDFALERSVITRKVFSHLVFVEFQYTTCLLATTAEIMLKRKIVAFQAGTAPGVHIREPILTAADSLYTAWEWCVRSGETGQRRSVTNFPQILHQLIKKKIQLLRHGLLQFRIIYDGKFIQSAKEKKRL